VTTNWMGWKVDKGAAFVRIADNSESVLAWADKLVERQPPREGNCPQARHDHVKNLWALG
jgi:hypothetical protein